MSALRQSQLTRKEASAALAEITAVALKAGVSVHAQIWLQELRDGFDYLLKQHDVRRQLPREQHG